MRARRCYPAFSQATPSIQSREHTGAEWFKLSCHYEQRGNCERQNCTLHR
jgi:hypothetical protein